MIKVKADEVKEILREMEEARGYILFELKNDMEAAVRRMMRLENRLRSLLGQESRWAEAEIAVGRSVEK